MKGFGKFLIIIGVLALILAILGTVFTQTAVNESILGSRDGVKTLAKASIRTYDIMDDFTSFDFEAFMTIVMMHLICYEIPLYIAAVVFIVLGIVLGVVAKKR